MSQDWQRRGFPNGLELSEVGAVINLPTLNSFKDSLHFFTLNLDKNELTWHGIMHWCITHFYTQGLGTSGSFSIRYNNNTRELIVLELC